jgi:hypothetical protein
MTEFFHQNDTWQEPDGARWFCYRVQGSRAWLSLESWVRQHLIVDGPPPASWTLADRPSL